MKAETQKILLAAALTGMLVCAASCGENKPAASTSAPSVSNAAPSLSEWNEQTTEPAETTDTAEITTTAEETTAAPLPDPKDADYSKVDVTVEWGDSELISKIGSDMWYGSYDGKIVKIDGIAEILGSWSIMEPAGEGSKTGFGFELVGSDDYPADGSRVEITGIILPAGGDWGARKLYVLPENVMLKNGNANDNVTGDTVSSPLKKGVWWAVADGGSAGYYFFRDQGSDAEYSEYKDQFYGIGVGFTYTLNDDGMSGTIVNYTGDTSTFTIEPIDDTTLKFVSKSSDSNEEYIEVLTFLSDDPDKFEFFSTSDLAEMAKAYYKNRYDYIPENADSELQADGSVTIHLYDVVDDHTASAAWYYVDRFTAKGTDFDGNAVDLEPYGRSFLPGGTRPAAWNPTVIQRQTLVDEDAFLGVRYLGYIDPAANDYGVYEPYIENILEYTCTYDGFPFMKEFPADRFVSTKDGQELYLIIPQDSKSTVYVYPQYPLDEYIGEVDPIYESLDGEPFLLKCNVSEIYADVKVVISSGGKSTEWYPGLSGENGEVLKTNTSDYKIYDFTQYEILAGPDQAPRG